MDDRNNQTLNQQTDDAEMDPNMTDQTSSDESSTDLDQSGQAGGEVGGGSNRNIQDQQVNETEDQDDSELFYDGLP